VAKRHAREHGSKAVPLARCVEAEAIVTCLPTSVEVDQIVDTLWELLREGTIWIDATSGDPVASRKTAARLHERGVRFVDAPVSGGVPGAEAGTLTVMVGGTDDDFARAEAVVKPFAGKIVHVGGVGAGHAIKVITNSMMAINMLGAAEGFLMARRYGIDLRKAFEVANAASGRSNVTENLLPLRLLEGKWPLVFKLSLHDKDIRIAASMAHEEHMATPMLALTSQLFTAALHDAPEADYLEAVKYVAKLNGEGW
jgi:3-hydroxyisobutyrate dehydrogenase